MTMALRVPILLYCCGPVGTVRCTAVISSSGRAALRFTPR